MGWCNVEIPLKTQSGFWRTHNQVLLGFSLCAVSHTPPQDQQQDPIAVTTSATCVGRNVSSREEQMASAEEHGRKLEKVSNPSNGRPFFSAS